MSNVGFSNLATLKAHVLPAAIVAGTDYDTLIASIGKGVAAQFEGHCQRKFQRAVATTYDAPADRPFYVLDRYPVETLTSIGLRASGESSFTSQGLTYIDQTLEKAGIVQLSGPLGTCREQLRFTFTGGYWWRVLEPVDSGYSSDTLPSGATAVPEDLVQAWILQCKHVLTQGNLLATQIAEKPVAAAPLGTLELLPDVVARLRRYIRHDML